MGDFLFAAMLWLLAAYGGYEIGQADHGRSIAKDCASTGATQIGNTFYSCEPVAALIEGEHVAFKKQHRED